MITKTMLVGESTRKIKFVGAFCIAGVAGIILHDALELGQAIHTTERNFVRCRNNEHCAAARPAVYTGIHAR